MNKHDWEIHKILYQAKGNTICICPARKNDKLYTQLKLYRQMLYGVMKNPDKLIEGWDYIIPERDHSEVLI